MRPPFPFERLLRPAPPWRPTYRQLPPTIPLDIEQQPPRPQGFLRLPPQLRQRIYLYIGVARFDGRPYTYYLDGHKEERRIRSELDPPPAGNFAGLLRSCRALHAETAALLYSANRFVIFYSQQGLKSLRALSPTSLASLTSLKIVLNESSCHHHTNSADYPPRCCCDGREYDGLYGARDCAETHGGLHGRPLLDPSLDFMATKAMLNEWCDTAAYLSTRVGVGRLELSLVTWSRQDRSYLAFRPLCRLEHEDKCLVHNGCRLSQCSVDYDPDPNAALSPGCFCRRQHAAFSVTCKCWAPPTDLFLICRALCWDAQFVFFSENRFIIYDYHALWPWDLPAVQLEPRNPGSEITEKYYSYERFAASEFLRDIVPTHCLADLRFLELVFPPYEPHGWPHNNHAPVLDWRATLDWLRGKVNAPALIIRLVMADFHFDGYNPVRHRKVLTENQGTGILKGYARVVEPQRVHGSTRVMHPLKPLVREDGLAGFYVQAAYLWRWIEETGRKIRRHGWEWLVEQEQALKERCERYVRGQDSGLASCQKPEPRKSTWQRLYK
ncbi:hypothetical protein C8A03DRAFT_19417 [Achaetomium macrosporum]|uniref:Uncharacterized protein n=1 Tax=Achaetomium macrosporum TaxID=79813 RepID=A0AAN7HA80_9PEZI|nr:hypothetical protein C8A03DRAFT_19417 [Achaetomium macrosporum]